MVLTLLEAGRRGRRFVEAARAAGGAYRLEPWPATRARRRPARPDVRIVAGRLRMAQRLTVGFLDPVEDALYLTGALRHLGYAASFHLGRELAPAAPPGGLFPWVECDGDVVSTSLPVAEEYLEIFRAPQADRPC